MRQYYYENDSYETEAFTENTNRSKSSSRKGIIIGVIITTVVALALGLGLGLGLRKKSTTDECMPFDRAQFSVRKAPMTNGTDWLKEDCAIRDKPDCPSGFQKPPLLIISLDGFRADYMKRNLTPVLDKISNCGVRTEYMRPVFPTKTFPNHYSIVTGLYPESHGIIANMMVDLELDQLFTIAGPEALDPRWWHGEPIWVTARKAGLKSATMFWPGSEIKINGYYPNRCYKYEKSVPFEMRVDRVLTWLDESDTTRPDVVAMYFHQPDSAGHKGGPDSELVNGNLTDVDNMIGNLMDGLIERKLHKCIDIIIVSDHGMTKISKTQKVDVKTPLNMGQNDGFVIDGEVARVTSKYFLDQKRKIRKVANGATADELVSRLSCVGHNTTREYYSKVYKKGDLPVRVHYVNSHRIEEVIVIASDEWFIEGGLSKASDGGSHGYDNIEENMQAFFMAYGSSIKNTEIEPIEAIEVYNLMSDILDISPEPNNGTAGRLHEVLRHPPSQPTEAPPGSDYKPITFPDDKAKRDEHRAASNCNCTSLSVVDVDITDLRLNLSAEQRAAAEKRHLGSNMPLLAAPDLNVWALVQESYVSAYSTQHHVPLWAAFELNEQSGADLVNVSGVCSRVDVRLEKNETMPCAVYYDPDSDVTASHLVPPGIVTDQGAQADAEISTNLVPMYTSFRDGVWRVMLEVLADYRVKYKKVHILMGPVFDDNRDSLHDGLNTLKKVPGSDVSMPSHYFVMVTRCNDTSVSVTACHYAALEVMTVLIPHMKTPGNCWNMGESKPFEYLQAHVARARDVELITGLRLLRGVPDPLHGLVLRTRLPIGLWAMTGWLDDEQCPKLNPAMCSNGGTDLPVLFISLDGFRPDYMDLGVSPVLEKLGSCGVSAPYIRSVYPTLTFPNHYSMATGLYPESHGIVENNMFDLAINSTFYLGSPNASDTRWWGGEPIWNTVTRQGKKSATFFWPGSDVEIGGMRPDTYMTYDGTVPYGKRVDTVLDWLTGRGGFKADLAVLYMEKVDKFGHSYGPGAPEISDAVSYVDGYLQRLMDGLKRHGLDGCVNIIITSDHGMADIDCDRGVQIGSLLPSEELSKSRVYNGAAGRMATTFDRNYKPLAPENRISVDEVVYNTSCKSEHMNVYATKSLPTRFHYANNERIGEVIFAMEESWLFNFYSPWCKIKGQHGWDPMTSNAMKAMFRSYGPSFKKNFTSPAFETIEIYNLITKLLSIEGSPNNGTEGSLYHLLSNETSALPLGGFENYTITEYPATDEDYAKRNESDGCSCQVPDGKTVRQYDDRLNLTVTRQDELTNRHLPHGRPRLDGQLDLKSVWAEDYLTAYSPTLGLPVWVAYTVTNQTIATGGTTSCLRPDVRLEPQDQATCANLRESKDYIDNFLFPPSLATSDDSIYDAYLLTNTVPMMQNFSSGVWHHMVSAVYNWTMTVGTLHVISGPVFDYDADGLADNVTNINITVGDASRIPVPSHFFVVILRCADGGICEDMNYDTRAFIIPHRTNVSNCMDMDTYLRENRARVRDIELLTGLHLLTAAGEYNSTAILARTRLPWTYGFSTVA